jgi:5-methylcytosine-specific restriction endonuclease McrA
MAARMRSICSGVSAVGAADGVCQVAPTAEAHHLDHAKPGDAAFWNPARIVGVCTPCHRRLTGERSVQVQRERRRRAGPAR